VSVTAKAEKITGLSVYYAGNSLWIGAQSFAEASSQIMVAYSKEDALAGRFEVAPFQVASFRHSPKAACAGVRKWAKSGGLA